MSTPFIQDGRASYFPQQQSPSGVQVTVGEITFDDEAAAFTNPEPDTVFADYKVFSYYDRDPHVAMMGVTSPYGFQGDDAAFVQLSRPTTTWVVDWTASRTKRQPIIPSPEASFGWVLLDEQVQPAMIVVANDGVTPLYRISGTYIYGRRRNSTLLVQDVTFPLPPWLENVFDRTMPAQFVQQGISDAGNLQRVK